MLQCWDASGNLVFDGTGRILKFYSEGSQNVSFSEFGPGRVFATIAVAGVSVADTVAVAWYYNPISGNRPVGVSLDNGVIRLRREPEGGGVFTVYWQLFKY